MATKKNESPEVEIFEIKTQVLSVNLLGRTPLIYNRMTEKAKRQLLFPSRPMSSAQKAVNLKHNPSEEYRNSAHAFLHNENHSRFYAPASWFKNALMQAALDVPGAKKTEIGRLLWILSDKSPLFGIPKLFMTPIITAGMNGSPDIRTRAILSEWCTRLSLEFVVGKISKASIYNLFAAAGLICGLGDFRQAKGKGNYGQFTVVGDDDKDFERIMRTQGREAQDENLESPEFYDLDSQELYDWYEKEFTSRHGK